MIVLLISFFYTISLFREKSSGIGLGPVRFVFYSVGIMNFRFSAGKKELFLLYLRGRIYGGIKRFF